MRLVLGLVGVLVGLPLVVLLSVLSSTLTRPKERTPVRLLRLPSAACLLVSGARRAADRVRPDEPAGP